MYIWQIRDWHISHLGHSHKHIFGIVLSITVPHFLNLPLVVQRWGLFGSWKLCVCLHLHLALQGAASKPGLFGSQNSPISSGLFGIHWNALHWQPGTLQGTLMLNSADKIIELLESWFYFCLILWSKKTFTKKHTHVKKKRSLKMCIFI